MDYTITLANLDVLTGDVDRENLKDTLTDLFLEHGLDITEIVLRLNHFQLIGSKDNDYTFDFRLYVISDDCSLRVAKFEQDLRIYIHNLSTFGLWT